METTKKRLSNGKYVWLTRVDEETGLIEFAGNQPQSVKNPGTYHYDMGGTMYKEACDIYRHIYDRSDRT